MSDDKRDQAADKLNEQGEDPEVESGAGYGSHAAETEKPDEPASGTQ